MNVVMTGLSTEQLEQYDRDGIVFPIRILSVEAADRFGRLSDHR